MTDAALMLRVATGDVDAFGVLVERHTPALYRVAVRMLGDVHEAEDVVQECFARLWQRAPCWRATGAGLTAYLYRVVMNLCFDRHRRFRVVTTDDPPDVVDHAPLADRVIEADQVHRAVARALADLPERHRAALILCYYEGQSNAIAAQVLELNVKAMESLLFRARKRMRDLLEARELTSVELLGLHPGCAA